MDKKTILITGGTGYLGSHLAHYWFKAGHSIGIIKRKKSSLDRLSKIKDRINFFNVEDELELSFEKLGNIDAVIHTATCYGNNNESIQSIFASNVGYPMLIIDLCLKYKVKSFFNTDTYFNKNNNHQEYLNNYTLSKKHFSEWIINISKKNIIKLFNIKLEHLFGPNDLESKFVNQIMIKCTNNISHIDLTIGTQKRDFIHINDIVFAYDSVLNNIGSLNKNYIEFGVGYGKSISVKKFVKMIHKISNSKTKLNFGAVKIRQGEMLESHADNEMLCSLGWRPKYSIEEAIRKTLSFYNNRILNE